MSVRPMTHANPQPNMTVSNVTLTERITTIRSNFDLSIVDLAAIFRVARQTVYDWTAERQRPESLSLARMRDLHALSIAWRADIGPNIETLHRKFADKDELLALLSVENLNVDAIRKALRRMAEARTAVAPQSKSITELMQEHGFPSASMQRQDEAITHASRQ
jgi:DNA-binding transcriptional regulator YiaG